MDYLLIFPEMKAALQRYQPADRCYLYEAMMDYAYTGTEPEWPESDMKWFVWDLLKQDVDRADAARKKKQAAGLASAERRRTQGNTSEQDATNINTPQHASTTLNTAQQDGTEGNPYPKPKPKRKPNPKPDSDRRFTPPTRDEVAAYIAEKGYHVDPDRWMAYYESNGWRVGRNPMKDWKAAVVTWERNGIDAKPARRVAQTDYAQRDYEETKPGEFPDWYVELLKDEETAEVLKNAGVGPCTPRFIADMALEEARACGK